MKRIMLACAAASALGGCFKANIHLADGPGSPGPVKEALHFSLIGIFELSSPIDLKMACATGPTVIHEQVSVLGGVINIVLGTFIPVLSVMTPSIDCGVGAGTGPAPMPPEGAAGAPPTN